MCWICPYFADLGLFARLVLFLLVALLLLERFGWLAWRSNFLCGWYNIRF